MSLLNILLITSENLSSSSITNFIKDIVDICIIRLPIYNLIILFAQIDYNDSKKTHPTSHQYGYQKFYGPTLTSRPNTTTIIITQ